MLTVYIIKCTTSVFDPEWYGKVRAESLRSRLGIEWDISNRVLECLKRSHTNFIWSKSIISNKQNNRDIPTEKDNNDRPLFIFL